jgi:glycosyltransferase involved in cell wall biosynthesis
MIIVSSHISDLEGPTEALVEYINNKFENNLVILHPLHYCSDRRTKILKKENKKDIKIEFTNAANNGFIITCFRDAIITLYTCLKIKNNSNNKTFIGVDPLNCFVGLILKFFGKIDKVIFYSIDWTPSRFENFLLNKLYHLIDKICAKKSDLNWNLSDKINEVRIKITSNSKKNILVPVGAKIVNIFETVRFKKKKLNNVVLLGALAPSKGCDLVINSWKKIIIDYPTAKLHIIGKTPNIPIENGIKYEPYENRFKKIGKSIKLYGIKNRLEVTSILKKMDLGLAVYKPDKNNLSNWADPSRIKDYLGSALPVITTRVAKISEEIKKNKCGIVIKYDEKELKHNIIKLLKNKKLNQKYSRNCLKFMKNYSWETIFNKCFDNSILTR